MTTNVTLWPQMLTVFANPDVDGRLTTAQRDWLRQAAEEAETRSAELADADARIARGGVRSWAPGRCEASDAELAALREAFAPVYTELARDAETKEVLDQIEAAEGVDPGPTRLERLFGLCGSGRRRTARRPRVPPRPT